MSGPALATIETIALFLAAGLMGASGARIALLAAAVPRPTGRVPNRPRTQGSGVGRGVLVDGAVVGASVLLVTLAAAYLPPRIGSVGDLIVGVGGGALSGYLLGGLGAWLGLVGRAAEGWRLHLDLRAPTSSESGAPAWAAATLSAGLGVLVVLLATIFAKTNTPVLLGLVVGTALPPLACRFRSKEGTIVPGTADAGGRTAFAPGAGLPPIPVGWFESLPQLASEAFAVTVTASSGAILLAYVSPIVRTVFPNAFLFPLLAVASVLVAGSIGSALGMWPRAARRSARLAVAGVSSSAIAGFSLLVLDARYMGWNVGILGAAYCGLVAGAVLSVAFAEARHITGRTARKRAIASGGVAGLVVALGAAAYLLAGSSGYWAAPNFVPSIGAYGIGLAAVGLSGTWVALGPILASPSEEELGAIARALAAPETGVPIQGEGPGLSRGSDRLALLGAATVGPAALSVLVAAATLGPTLSGVSPAQFQNLLLPPSPGFVGAVIAGGAAGVFSLGTHVRGSDRRLRTSGVGASRLALAVFLPLGGGFVLGPVVGWGVLLGILLAGPAAAAGRPPPTEQTWAGDFGAGEPIVVLAACVLGALLLPAIFASAWLGRL